MEKNILKDIEEKLLSCEKPSLYLEEIKSSFEGTPLKILLELENTEQNKEFHPEGNVWNHVMQVVDTAATIKEFANDKATFMLGALLHDIGKVKTTKKNKQGRWTSYNHDQQGVKDVKKILDFYDYDENKEKKILDLVRFHMHHLYIIKNLPFAQTEDMIKNVDLHDIILLFICDRLGRGQKEKSKKIKEIGDIKVIIDSLEKNYDLNLCDIRSSIEKIIKII